MEFIRQVDDFGTERWILNHPTLQCWITKYYTTSTYIPYATCAKNPKNLHPWCVDNKKLGGGARGFLSFDQASIKIQEFLDNATLPEAGVIARS